MVDYFRERKTVFWLGVMILVITTIPYLTGYFHEGTSWRFSGFVFGVEDGNSYIAKMLRGATGDWLFRTPYTGSEQKGILTFFAYQILGKLSYPPAQHDQLVSLFQLFRWISGFLVVFATYDFCALYFSEKKIRIYSTALITIGGGFGWLMLTEIPFVSIGHMPLEFYSPETFGFLSLYGIPHLALSRAMMLWGFVLFVKKRPAVWIGILWFLMSLIQPLTVLTAWFYLGMYILLTTLKDILAKNESLRMVIREMKFDLHAVMMIVITSSPVVVHTFLSLRDNLFFQQWAQQNVLKSPPWGDYFISFLPLLPLLAIQLIETVKNTKNNNLERPQIILFAWVISFPILAYFPYQVQRRLPDGIWVAVLIISMTALRNLPQKIKIYGMGLLGTCFISTIMMIWGGMSLVSHPAQPIFIPKAESDAFQFISDHLERDALVLSSFESGNALPAWAPMRVVIGHGPESIHLGLLQPMVADFYDPDGMELEERLEFLIYHHIDYVLLGKNENKLGNWTPGMKEGSFLKKIYDLDGYQIYQVRVSN